MKKLLGLFIAMGWILIPVGIYGVSCADLNTDAKIKAFIKKSNNSNPLLRENSSVTLNLSPCEGAICGKNKKRERNRIRETIYSVKSGNKKRIFFARGPNAPQCLVERGKRQFWCSRCSWTSNEQCRSYKVGKKPTIIRGTNIDRSDLEQMRDRNHKSKCSELKKQPKFLKIVTRKLRGDAPYDKIISFYNKKREHAVTINLFSDGVLRKVYRFFPKYHVKIGGHWVATVVRVRTTQGKESAYLFETLVNVAMDKNKKYKLYLNPRNDPRLKSAQYDFLFNTN